MILRFTMYHSILLDRGDLSIEASDIRAVVEGRAEDETLIARLICWFGSFVVRDETRTATERWVRASGGLIDEEP